MGGRPGEARDPADILRHVPDTPALTIPAATGLPPVGIQLIGRPYADARVLDIGAAIERMLRT